MSRAAMILLAFAGLGCATDLENAVLELTVQLPTVSPRATGPQYAYVQVSKSLPFAEPWPMPTVDGVLLGSSPMGSHYSVVAEPMQVAGPLRVKVRICQDIRCAAMEDMFASEARAEIERSHYLGARTFAVVTLDTADFSRIRELGPMPKCEVEGCDEPGLASYCDTDGRHFCE